MTGNGSSGSNGEDKNDANGEPDDSLATLVAGISEICSKFHAMGRELSELKERMDVRETNRGRPQFRRRSSFRGRSSSGARAKSPNQPYCWYHFRFGANSTKCRPPCTFVSPKND